MKTLITSCGKKVLVDDNNFSVLNKHRWYVGKHKYAFRHWRHRPLYMHRFILGARAGQRVDHVNGNGLDNRRKNLRICSHSKNLQNQIRKPGPHKTSRFKGVSWDKRCQRWEVGICAGPKNSKGYAKRIFLGRYISEVKAARVYDAAARRHFGEFANTNFVKRAT